MFRLYKEAILKYKEKSWSQNKELILRENKLKEEKQEVLQNKNKLSTSKLLILFLFINCSIIEIFTGYITLKTFSVVEVTATMPDFTPLVTLIGAVVSEVIGFAIYSLKAAKENSKGGLVYDLAMLDKEEECEEELDDDIVQG